MSSFEHSHHTVASEVVAIANHIVIDYLESFGEKVKNGIIIVNEDQTERGIRPRWGKVHAVGPDQLDVNPGEWILIKHGSWTRGTLIDGKIYRRVDPNEIFLASDEKFED